MKEALFYTKLPQKKVHCQLCAHECKIPDGNFGFCQVRQNICGVLYTHDYGKLVAANADPIEKKPLYHFLPGTKTFSVAGAGCNFRCGFCQNWQISQVGPGSLSGESLKTVDLMPDQIVRLARQNDCQSIAYTYTEPTVFFEFALDTAKLAKAAGLYNIFVTNGYMNVQAIKLIKPYLDAVNVDLKFFKDGSYRKICGASLEPVLESIRSFYQAGVWTEITTLVIPEENDSAAELAGIADFIAQTDKNIPWHISAFHADYKFKAYPDTPVSALKKAYDLGKKAGLHYIYLGNIDGAGQDTVCTGCQEILIKRAGFRVVAVQILQDKCRFCQTRLPGVYIS